MDARDLEVRCESCDAGFAAGTPECIHCGRRLPKKRRSADPDLRLQSSSRDLGNPADFPHEPELERTPEARARRPREGPGPAQPEEDDIPVGGLINNLFPGMLALGFLAVSYVLRACGNS